MEGMGLITCQCTEEVSLGDENIPYSDVDTALDVAAVWIHSIVAGLEGSEGE
jgi:hypothetical protein